MEVVLDIKRVEGSGMSAAEEAREGGAEERLEDGSKVEEMRGVAGGEREGEGWEITGEGSERVVEGEDSVGEALERMGEEDSVSSSMITGRCADVGVEMMGALVELGGSTSGAMVI